MFRSSDVLISSKVTPNIIDLSNVQHAGAPKVTYKITTNVISKLTPKIISKVTLKAISIRSHPKSYLKIHVYKVKLKVTDIILSVALYVTLGVTI